MKLSDFKDLKVLKKELTPKPEYKGHTDVPCSKTVAHGGKEKACKRNDGLVKGQKVRMMDSNETAVIVDFGKDDYVLNWDGIMIRATRSEFYPVRPEEERMLRTLPSGNTKAVEDPVRAEDPLADVTVDLHLERIPGSAGIPEWAALDYQMDYFRRILRKNLKYKGKRIIFIHGVGDGVLAKALRKELDEVFALSCSYTPGSMGITNVTIR